MAHATEKIRAISNQCMQDTLASQQYDAKSVPVWVNAIDRNIMNRLKTEVCVSLFLSPSPPPKLTLTLTLPGVCRSEI